MLNPSRVRIPVSLDLIPSMAACEGQAISAEFKLNAISTGSGWIPAQLHSHSPAGRPLCGPQSDTHWPGGVPLSTGLQVAPGSEHPPVFLSAVQSWAFAAYGTEIAAIIISAITKERKRAASAAVWLASWTRRPLPLGRLTDPPRDAPGFAHSRTLL